jgi:plastocyanin
MRSIITCLTLLVFTVSLTPEVRSEPRAKKSAPTRADLERLEARIEDQQKQIDRLLKAQQQYLNAVKGMFGDTSVSVKDEPKVEPKVEPVVTPPAQSEPKTAAVDKTAPAFTDTKAAKSKLDVAPRPKKLSGNGTVVGKVTGASGAVIYIEDINETVKASATMRQEGKSFVPSVLVVQKGTSVAFPNLDAIFHNVFSVTPDHSFDLGSYQKGESKSVTMGKSGVLSVYCNMHPQMVGHILVVPSSHYVRAGNDGFFKLQNVPAGRHRVVAWAPNSKPVTAEAEVSEAGVVTLELELKKGRAAPHTKKDGLPYGSYAE